MESSEITFDESDKNLFQVDDFRLRADALKHSLLPRLRYVLNESISLIREIYDVEVLENSRISHYPQFKTKRDNELNFLYEAAYVGIGGKSAKDKWFGVERNDRKPVQTLPFRYGFQITEDGLITVLETYWLKGLTDESHKKFFAFCIENESLLHTLCYRAEMYPDLYSSEEIGFVSTFKQHYIFMYERGLFENNFISSLVKYPINLNDLAFLTHRFAFFYPVYDSYLQIAMNKQTRFDELIEKLNEWKIREFEGESSEDMEVKTTLLSEEELLKAKEAAEQTIKVMPALRWQVFQRDNWKCVSCGRGSQDDVILHVDHITPRSRGGKDELSNYQTLCHLCNIGKSNKDATDLRNRK